DGSVSSQQRQAIDALATKVADLRRSASSGPDRSAQLSLLEPQLSDAQRQYLLQADEGTVATVFKSAGDILQALEANGIKADTLKSAQDTAQTRAAALHLDSTGGSVVATLVRAFLLVISRFAVALGYLMQFRPAILRDPRQLATLGGLMLGLLVVAKVFVPINPNAQYLVPMVAVPLLVAALMDTGLGIIVALAV